jgi:hypothetical protein
MGLREWMSGFRRHHDPQRDQVPDMAEIRELARAASAYEQVPAAPGSDGLHRSGFVDVRPSLLDEREMDGRPVWRRPVPLTETTVLLPGPTSGAPSRAATSRRG